VPASCSHPCEGPHTEIEALTHARLDVEAESKWQRMFMGATPESPRDRLELDRLTDTTFNHNPRLEAHSTLLTLVGSSSQCMGEILGTSGEELRGDPIAASHQLAGRLQLYRVIAPEIGE
jgi:hypothetical protein